jgi:hypothetical protein
MRKRSVEDYINDYYSVAKFKKAYDHVINPMIDRNQWPQVEMVSDFGLLGSRELQGIQGQEG